MSKGRTTVKKSRSEGQEQLDGASKLYLHRIYPPHDEHGYCGLAATVDSHLVLGRERGVSSADGILDIGVSRRHCRISETGGRFVVVDLGSSNGTFLNGKRIAAAPLETGDVVRLGDTIFLAMDAPPVGLARLRQAGIVVDSPSMGRVLAEAELAAPTADSVLLLGETGTGKDLLAAHIHECSGRSGQFVVLNCATVQDSLAESTLFGTAKGAFTGAVSRPGLVERADCGTLFLNEIGELSPPVQAKLLHFIETSELQRVGETVPTHVDVRIIAATNRTDDEGTIGGTLREDLLGRLEDWTLCLPPLRARRGDILPLLCKVIEDSKLASSAVLTADFVEKALIHRWPRNVRQLIKASGACLRLVAREGGRLEGDALDRVGGRRAITPGPEGTTLGRPTPEQVQTMLDDCGGNVSEAARRYGFHRRQLHRWIARYGLKK